MAEFQTSLAAELESEVKNGGAELLFFTDISQLPSEQNRGYPTAILLGITLSPDYLQILSSTPDYIQQMLDSNQLDKDEFHVKERLTDKLADKLADYLSAKGYSAYSQSENNLDLTGCYNEETKHTPLPHKTIAGLAGLGWIGKHNLLVNTEYGSAISMCTLLTDAPLMTVLHPPVSSQCGDCTVCVDNCPESVITGKSWTPESFRDELVDVYRCTTCLKCLALCPWTQKYADSTLSNIYL